MVEIAPPFLPDRYHIGYHTLLIALARGLFIGICGTVLFFTVKNIGKKQAESTIKHQYKA